MKLLIIRALWFSLGLALAPVLAGILNPAQAQEMPQAHEHPAPGSFDPFGQASSIKSERWPAGINCCHGEDCKIYEHLPPPQRVTSPSRGYKFQTPVGEKFFEDERRIDVSTLDESIRNEVILCISKDGYPYCWHWPVNG